MNVMNKAGLILLAAPMSACHVGPQITDLDLAHNPDGATVEVQIFVSEGRGRMKFEGELLEIRSEGLVFSGSDANESVDEVIFVAWNRARRVKAFKFGGYDATIGQSLEWKPAAKERFRLISRFPQGISPEIMNGLLAAHRQEELRRFE